MLWVGSIYAIKGANFETSNTQGVLDGDLDKFLEAALYKKPMVVVYRMSSLSYWFLRIFNIIHTDYISLPNILLDKKIVPELIQKNASSKAIYEESFFWLSNPQDVVELRQQFNVLHLQLRKNASVIAASKIVKMLEEK